jgi:hypothetical protein
LFGDSLTGASQSNGSPAGPLGNVQSMYGVFCRTQYGQPKKPGSVMTLYSTLPWGPRSGFAEPASGP